MENDLREFTPGNEVAAATLERRVRADERERCIREIRALAAEYVEKWAPTVGQDQAKADA